MPVSSHSSQASLRGPLAKLPSAHGVCCVEPVVVKWPGSAVVHSLAAVRSVLSE